MQEAGRKLFAENMRKKLAKKPWIAEKCAHAPDILSSSILIGS